MIRRSGNFGFVDNGAGDIYTFSMGDGGWTPSSFMLRGGHSSFGYKYMNVNGIRIIPFGADNDLPTRVRELLEEFYAGEGIMGKKAGLQWGEGPRLYRDAVDETNNMFYRAWTVDQSIMDELKATDYLKQMHRCLIDLCHLEGFWVKVIRSRGTRIGRGRIARIEHGTGRQSPVSISRRGCQTHACRCRRLAGTGFRQYQSVSAAGS